MSNPPGIDGQDLLAIALGIIVVIGMFVAANGGDIQRLAKLGVYGIAAITLGVLVYRVAS